MDDDLMSLRSSVSSSKKDDDDLLGGFGSSMDASKSESPNIDFGSLDDQPDWLKELGPQPEVAAPVKSTAEKKKAPKQAKKPGRARRSRKSSAGFMGLTPQQRVILSLFLFLEVAVIGVFLLLAIGAINIP
jgi:hypothetical protein